MPEQSDTDDLFETLAKLFGCADGVCGYDFDEQCYWWLQSKVQEELENPGTHIKQPKTDNEFLSRFTNVNWEAANWNSSLLDTLRNMQEQFGWGRIKPLPFETTLSPNGFFISPADDYVQMVSEQDDATRSIDPFDNGYHGPNFKTEIVRDCTVQVHGGSADGRVEYMAGPLRGLIRWQIPVMTNRDPWTVEAKSETYRLVIIGNEAHYFYEPRAT